MVSPLRSPKTWVLSSFFLSSSMLAIDGDLVALGNHPSHVASLILGPLVSRDSSSYHLSIPFFPQSDSELLTLEIPQSLKASILSPIL